jgi:AcrR family transcriptional regulator
MTADALSRDERRRRTEAAILQAAREQFADAGFERTTIRSVATATGVDPALVMQYYGSKEGLFAAASRWKTDHEQILQAPSDSLVTAALQDLFGRFEDDEDRGSAAALLRNCLTHPSALAAMRDEVMCERKDAVAAALEGPDAQLRAALFGACMIGLGMARYLLELEPVASASREDVERLIRPALEALLGVPTGGPAPG